MLAISLYLSSRALDEQLRLAEAGDIEGAVREVERAARLDRFSPVPLSARAFIEQRRGRPEAAANAFNLAIDRDPVNYSNYVSLGNLQQDRLDNPAAAAESYRRALERNPHSTEISSQLARTLMQLEDYDGARERYEWLARTGRISLQDRFNLGRVYVRTGDPEQAVRAFQMVKRQGRASLAYLDPQQRASQIQFLESVDLAIADALVVQRRYGEARQVLEESPAEQAPAILDLIQTDPEGYRESVLDDPIT